MGSNKILGSFEQMVLLGVLKGGDAAFGLEVRRILEEDGRRSVSRGAFYTTVDRLGDKGYLTWHNERGDAERQRMPRRRFEVTAEGLEALRDARGVMDRLSAGLEDVLQPA
ncbi:MAG: helix-turn-helix transcriptional regulator [Gemmatimonadota bacterium]|nr:helix-turn-helix transcriptional regulator [Gemmatimonadota bacterium]